MEMQQRSSERVMAELGAVKQKLNHVRDEEKLRLKALENRNKAVGCVHIVLCVCRAKQFCCYVVCLGRGRS